MTTRWMPPISGFRIANPMASLTPQAAEGVNLDVASDNQIVGIEILNASHRLPLKSLFIYELGEESWPARAA